MDDRRRPISPREPVMGEALLRVSNTLEAQRLTKSLDYQEKLRSRANIRMIISIICLCIALGCLIVGGFLLTVLIKYEDPIIDSVVPYIKSSMNASNVKNMAKMEAATYKPYMTELKVRMAEQKLAKAQAAAQGIDFSAVIDGLTGLLGNASGMVTDLRGAIGTVASSAGGAIGEVGNSVSTAIGDFTQNANEAIGSVVGGLGNAVSDGSTTEAAAEAAKNVATF